MKIRTLLFFLSLLHMQLATAQIRNLYGGSYLQNVKSDEATIVWVADRPSIGWVELAPNDGTHFYRAERPRYFDTTDGVKNISRIHSVKLKSLKPGTTYRYRVCSREVLEHKGTRVIYGSADYHDAWAAECPSFTTCDPNKPETSFAMICDIHGRDSIIPTLLKYANYKEKDFIVFNGDMVTSFTDEATVFNGFMAKSIELFASSLPMHYARGNHETRGQHATSFHRYFSPKEPHLYYTFRQGPVCFIILDCGEDKPDSSLEYYGITDYDNYRTEEAEWLKGLKDDKELKSAKYRVVITHIPPSNDKRIWHGQREFLEKFVPVLNDMAIDLMLCGHLHETSYAAPNELVNFPVLVNSNNSVASIKAGLEKMEIEVTDLTGKRMLRKEIHK